MIPSPALLVLTHRPRGFVMPNEELIKVAGDSVCRREVSLDLFDYYFSGLIRNSRQKLAPTSSTHT